MSRSIACPKEGHDRFPFYIGALFLILWGMLAIQPANRLNWFVENILVILGSLLLVLTYKKFRFSNLSYVLIFVLLFLHALGAHYTYGKVPISIHIPLLFDPDRNNFDRIVHFSWGLLISYPIYEFLLRIGRILMKWIYIIVLSFVIASSSIFELIEMWGARMLSENQADMYLGMQGDIWDAHEDIAMALYGSLITMGVVLYARYREKKQREKSR